jgi:hypothetical protein
MIGVTSFGLFLTPIFYVLLRGLVTGTWQRAPAADRPSPPGVPVHQGVSP